MRKTIVTIVTRDDRHGCMGFLIEAIISIAIIALLVYAALEFVAA